MHRKNSPDKKVLDSLRQALISDRTNVDAANHYWRALGSWQSGPDVIEAFRTAALTSREGVVAFARAYRELFENSGEAPRAVLFDDKLLRALEESVAVLPGEDCASIQWVLQSARSSRV